MSFLPFHGSLTLSMRTASFWSFVVLLICLYSSESLFSCFVYVDPTTVTEAFLQRLTFLRYLFIFKKEALKILGGLCGSEPGQPVSFTTGQLDRRLTWWGVFPNVIICMFFSGAIQFLKKNFQISCLRAASSKQNSARGWVCM